MKLQAPSRRPALFLDRDGVINVDYGFVHRIDQIDFVDGVFELVGFAVGVLGWPVIVASNQSGIGRGKFDEAAYRTLTRWLDAQFRRRGAPIARFYHCPFHPLLGVGDYKREHPWRKPSPGMILQAAEDFSIDLAGSVLIGDQARDLEAGAAAGVGLLLGLAAPGSPADLSGAHRVVGSLHEALAILKDRAGAAERERVI